MIRKGNANHDEDSGRFASGDGDGDGEYPEGFTDREADAMEEAGRTALLGAIDGSTTQTHLDNIQTRIDQDHDSRILSDAEHARLTERIKRRRASVKKSLHPPGAHSVYNGR